MTRRANQSSAIARREASDAILMLAVSSVWEKIAKPQGFHLETDFLVPTLPIKVADLLCLFEIVLTNAVAHHDQPTGCVSVASATDGAFTCVTISDDGPGIAPIFHAEVFDPSEPQDDSAVFEKAEPGLPKVQQIVDFYEGHVDIAPITKPRGTTVRVWIPSHPA